MVSVTAPRPGTVRRGECHGPQARGGQGVGIASANAAREQSRESREHERRQRQEALNSEPVNLAIEVLKAEIVEIRPLGANAGRGGRND